MRSSIYRGLFASCICVSAWIFLSSAVARQDFPILTRDAPPANSIWLDSLDLSKIEQGWGNPHAGRSVDNNPIKIHGVSFVHGVGTHAESEMRIDLKGAATRFLSMVGVDDETQGRGTIRFEVWVDGRKVAETGVLRGGTEMTPISADLTGAKELVLTVVDGGDGIDYDHADWAGAMLVMSPGATV
ncbi:MAG: NPCBM/NEW2 domain-containing protein [Acidobacteriota bacterium]